MKTVIKNSGRLAKVKSRAKELFIDGVQSGCGGMHLGLKYVIDGVEILEGTIVERMTGQLSNSVRKARQRSTIKRQSEISEGYQAMKSRIKSYADMRLGSDAIDISNETLEGDLL